jgi:hypothetical protein
MLRTIPSFTGNCRFSYRNRGSGPAFPDVKNVPRGTEVTELRKFISVTTPPPASPKEMALR